MEEQASARNVAVELFPASDAAVVFGKSAAPAAEAVPRPVPAVTEADRMQRMVLPAGTAAVQEALPVNSVAEAAEKHAASVTEKVLSLMTAFCAMGQKPVLSVAEQGRSRTNSQ